MQGKARSAFEKNARRFASSRLSAKVTPTRTDTSGGATEGADAAINDLININSFIRVARLGSFSAAGGHDVHY